jgi:pimeloyl-ACP methyl ester carboxylesterase
MRPKTLFLSIAIIWIGCLTQAADPVDVQFKADYDGSTQRYVVIEPDNLNNVALNNALPIDLIVALHGHGSDRWQFIKSDRPECAAAREIANRERMLCISPDYRAKTSWMGPAAEADIIQILDILKQKYNIGRTIFYGGSMGGTSVLSFAAMHPEKVDGVVALNGLANHFEYDRFQEAIRESFGGTKAEVPEQYYRRSSEYWPLKLTMPIAATVGGKDKSVPPASVRRLIDVLQKLGRDVILIDRPETGHSTNYEDSAAALEFVLQKTAPINRKESQ